MIIYLKNYKPVSLNKLLRCHWSTYTKYKQECERTFNEWWLTSEYRLKKNLCIQFPIKKCNIKLTYCFIDKRKRDYDNYSGKIILDVLKQYVIADDNSEVIRSLTHQFINGHNENCVLIEVISLEG